MIARQSGHSEAAWQVEWKEIIVAKSGRNIIVKESLRPITTSLNFEKLLDAGREFYPPTPGFE